MGTVHVRAGGVSKAVHVRAVRVRASFSSISKLYCKVGVDEL